MPEWKVTEVDLPGAAAAAPVSVDYIAYEPPSPAAKAGRVWVPIGTLGSVGVFDIAESAFTSVAGFGTAEREAHGKKRRIGPSSVAIGDGYAYVGDRATNELCPVALKTLKREPCATLPAAPDGVLYIPSKQQVWVTVPAEPGVVIFDTKTAPNLVLAYDVKIDGEPEGYAVDEAHGVFVTNLEDKNKTLLIDLTTREVKSTWDPGCGEKGPRGVAVDGPRNVLFVACTDHIQTLNLLRNGEKIARLDVGEGVDNIDYRADSTRLFVAAGGPGRLAVASLRGAGALVTVGGATTHAGARNAVADAKGNAYLVDATTAHLVIAHAPVAESAP